MNYQQFNSTISFSTSNYINIPSQTSINCSMQDQFNPAQVNYNQYNCDNSQKIEIQQEDLKNSDFSEYETSRSSILSNNSNYNQISSESERYVQMGYQLEYPNKYSMDIESEHSSTFEERKNNTLSYYQQGSQSHLIQGDFLVDLSQLESLIQLAELKQGNQVDFSNSQINNWKKCTQIEKDSSENGCFYLSINEKSESQLTAIEEIRELLNSLKERKLSVQNQMTLEEIEKFDHRLLMIENLLDKIEANRMSLQESSNYLQSSEFSSICYNNYQQSVKNAKNIMRRIVNQNGSTKSFVFGQLKAFNPSKLAQETTQLIYSPKLIQILYDNNKQAGDIFYNQMLRKGIIEIFDSFGHLTLSQLEIQQSENEKNSSDNCKKDKKSLVLYTSDNFQIPITVTLQKYNLIDEEQQSSTCAHELCVFDIKIKIKYQKQLNQMRKSHDDSILKKKISKLNSSNGKKQIKRKSISQKSNEKQECACKNCDNCINRQTETQEENFGYYLESLGFVNKFYPEKLSEGEKFEKVVLQKK